MGGGQSSQKVDEMPPFPLNFDAKSISNLKSYSKACKSDPQLQAMDQTLYQVTSPVINTLVKGAGVGGFSFDSLREVLTSMLKTNREVVQVILECKKDIWNDQNLFSLVEDYFNKSLQMLDFCNALVKCLKRAHESQLILQFAIRKFEEEELGSSQETKYVKTMAELKNFKAAGDPFTEEFFTIFQSVHKEQKVMLERLNDQCGKLDRKLKRAKYWRMVTCAIFIALLVTCLILSVVAAAMTLPPVVVMAGELAGPIGSVSQWCDSLLKNYMEALKGQREVIASMQKGTYATIKDMETIRTIVTRLETEIESATRKVDSAMRDEEALKYYMGEIKKNMMVLEESVDGLGKYVDQCSEEIRRARRDVLQRIVKSTDP